MYVALTLFIAIPASRQVFFKPTGEISNRCSNGHIGDLDAKFCQECGKKFRMEEVEGPTELFAQVCEKQGWDNPTVGFEELLGNGKRGWIATCGTSADCDYAAYQILLAPINVEAAQENRVPQVYGLGIRLARIGGIGEDSLTEKVLEIPLAGFPQQAETLKEVAELLGIEGEPALYPQVKVSY